MLSRKDKLKLIAALALWAAVMLTACNSEERSVFSSQKEYIKEEPRNIKLETQSAHKTLHKDILHFHGVIKGGNSYNEAIFETGKLATLHAKEGQYVSKGDIIAELYSPVLAEKLTQAKARLKKAEIQLALDKQSLQRNKHLLNKSLISKQYHDQIQSDFDASTQALKEAKAEVELAINAYDDTSIVAQGNGVVSKVFKREGDFINRGESIFRIELTDKKEISFSLPEKLAVQVNIGDQHRIYIPSISTHITGRVVEKSLPTNNSIRLHTVTVRIDEAPQGIVGLRAILQYEAETISAYKVDYRAIRYTADNKPYVVQTGDSPTLTPVSIVSMKSDYILVSGNINEDSPILIGNESSSRNLYSL